MSFQFSPSRSVQNFESKSLEKFWKLIAGKILKAFWKQIAGIFLKAKELVTFWKEIAGNLLKANRWKIVESKSLENVSKLFESKSLDNFWKQNAGKILKALERSVILFLQWLRYASDEFLCICARKSWDLLMKTSHKAKYIEFSKFWKQSLAKFWTLSFQKAFNSLTSRKRTVKLKTGRGCTYQSVILNQTK